MTNDEEFRKGPPLTLLATVILVLEKRIWVAAFGIFMGVTGVVLHLPSFALRGRSWATGGWWTWSRQGLVVLGVLTWVALSPFSPPVVVAEVERRPRHASAVATADDVRSSCEA